MSLIRTPAGAIVKGTLRIVTLKSCRSCATLPYGWTAVASICAGRSYRFRLSSSTLAAESRIESLLRTEVLRHGGDCEKHVSPGRRGVPDRLVTWPGGMIDFIETKAPNGVLKPWQQRDHEKRRKLGCNVFVLWTEQQVRDYIKFSRAGL